MNGDDLFWLLAIVTVLALVLGVAGWWAERYCERRRSHDLPPPDDPRLRNAEAIARWRRIRAIARSRGMA